MMKFGTEYDNFTRARDFWFLDVGGQFAQMKGLMPLRPPLQAMKSTMQTKVS